MRRTRTADVAFGQVWPTLAKNHGLTFKRDDSGSGTITGDLEGRAIEIAPRTRFKRPGSFVKIEMTISNPQDCYFTLASGFRSSLLKRYRAKGLETGDKTFDNQFMLKGDPQPLVKLTYNSIVLRKALLRARWMGSLDIKLYGKTLTFLLKDQGMANVRHMDEYLASMTRLANTIDELPSLLSLTQEV